MARRSDASKYQRSLWDRLTAREAAPGAGAGAGGSALTDERGLKTEVLHDLDWLLNSRRPPVPVPEGMETLRRSMMTYGLPDFTSISLNDPSERDRLQETIAATVREFEPRLFNIRVTFNPLDQDKSRASLHYRIDAMLRTDPVAEPVVFDTVVELGSGAITVRCEGA